MAELRRVASESNSLLSTSPQLAVVVNHLDPDLMGALEVQLLRANPADPTQKSANITVRYCSPFLGTTDIRFEGTDSAKFDDVQKTYGFWMVPPDIGTTVMVLFIDGDINQGYWFGCVPDKYKNQMIPGIAASQYSAITPEQERYYGTKNLPVAEYHVGSRTGEIPKPDTYTKPIHPFANRLLAQGLLLDNIRGITSSTARREAPSTVFGISTPGPIDKNGPKKQIGFDQKVSIPVSRLGGTTFVMDDGDADGQNELVRIRTRTGHQILMHNSSDLIYIANSKGTAWIEMTSQGKLDIYAEDSISVHSAADFNFRADRDINIEAGRNFNIRAKQDMETNVTGHYFLIVDDYAKISIRNDKDETIGQNSRLSVGSDLSISSSQNTFLEAGAGLNLAGESGAYLSSGIDVHIGASGTIYESGGAIHLNGPPATAAGAATPATQPVYLSLFANPNRTSSAGWSDGKFYKADSIISIMQRVPTHEPWDQHENINPTQFTAASTDVTLQNTPGSTRATAGIAPTDSTAAPANPPDVVPGVCSAASAKAIGAASAQAGIQSIKDACAKSNITSPYMIATMLGVAGGESAWTLVTENFNYKADRLLQVFPSVFKGDLALANQYAHNPNNSLPEFLYGYQSAKGQGLGNTQPGDGAKYIGRGFIGLTGRGNYTKFSTLLYNSKFTDTPTALLDNPDLVNDPKIAGAIVVLYFLSHPTLQTANKNPGPDYFEKGYRAVGYCTPDIYARKLGYYQCFLNQLSPPKTS